MVSLGYLPVAVSAESITASVPSSTALATSNTSARVGIGLSRIDSIICVAVMITQFRLRARLIIFFCTAGRLASPISTPRSPRATITASDALIMASRFSSASARSILAMIPPSPPASRNNCRARLISSALRGNETATKSASMSAAVTISALSFSVSASAVNPPPLRLMPLLSDSSPPTSTLQLILGPSTDLTCSTIRPSSSTSTSFALTSSGSFS